MALAPGTCVAGRWVDLYRHPSVPCAGVGRATVAGQARVERAGGSPGQLRAASAGEDQRTDQDASSELAHGRVATRRVPAGLERYEGAHGGRRLGTDCADAP
jgi:hypothetical protein